MRRVRRPEMNGFISYAHDDYKIFNEFRPHLRALERAFDVHLWSDQRINAGYHWNNVIIDQIERAELFVLLVSPAFIASDYIYENELPAIRARKKSPTTLVLPVVLLRCSWQCLCGALQALPTDGGRLRPISDWRPRRNGYDEARAQITNSFQQYYGVAPNIVDWPVLP
jgi:hypothetical protein